MAYVVSDIRPPFAFSGVRKHCSRFRLTGRTASCSVRVPASKRTSSPHRGAPGEYRRGCRPRLAVNSCARRPISTASCASLRWRLLAYACRERLDRSDNATGMQVQGNIEADRAATTAIREATLTPCDASSSDPSVFTSSPRSLPALRKRPAPGGDAVARRTAGARNRASPFFAGSCRSSIAQSGPPPSEPLRTRRIHTEPRHDLATFNTFRTRGLRAVARRVGKDQRDFVGFVFDALAS
jgi:hypothetical protein